MRSRFSEFRICISALVGALLLWAAPIAAQVPGGGVTALGSLSGGNCIKGVGLATVQSTGAPCASGSGTVSAGLINQLGYYAAAGTTISGLTTGNNGVLVTSAGGVPSISSTLPSGLSIGSPTFTGTVAGANTIPFSILAQAATNTVLGNSTSGTANVTALSVGGCSSAASALIWTTNTGFGCNTSITANTLSSTLGVSLGGTGQTTFTDGQLLIGNSSGNTLTKASLSAGANITITPGNGSITIAAAGGGGGCSTAGSATQVLTDNGSGGCTSNPGALYATGTLSLGTAGSLVGSVAFKNATSGTLTLSPPTGALGSVTVTVPAATDTLVNLAGVQTLTNKTLTSPTFGGTVAGANTIPLTILAQAATNTVLGNFGAGTGNITAQNVVTCSTSASALNWTTNTGFGCNTSINAATLGGATFAAPGAIGGGTPGAGTHTTLTANTSFTLNGSTALTSVSGNGAVLVSTTGAQTSGDCVKIDANGNHIANGSACGGSGSITWNDTPKTTAFNASSNNAYCVDTATTGAVTGTAPASPAAGDVMQFVDCNSNWAVANFTLARNGKKIMGISEDMVNAVRNGSFTVRYDSTNGDWRLQ